MSKDFKSDKIITSQTLHEQVNAERKREGKGVLPEINAVGGTSTGELARRDKSWNSVPGFFAKLFKGTGEEKDRAVNAGAKASEKTAKTADDAKESGDE